MNKLILGIKGHAVCIDKTNGDTVWDVKLKSTSGVTNILVDDNCVFVYSGGHIFCLDIHNGNLKWENNLKGMGYGPCIMASQNQQSSVVASDSMTQQSSAALLSSSSSFNDDCDSDAD